MRRWIAGILLVLLLTLVGGYYYFTRPAWLIRFAEQYLASLINGDVAIDHATFSIFDGIHLQGVKITVPQEASGYRLQATGPSPEARSPEPGAFPAFAGLPVFSCESLALKHDPIAALTGRLKIAQISAVGTHLTLISDPASGRLNISELIRAAGESAGGLRSAGSAFEKPRIQLPNARFSFHKVIDGEMQFQQQAYIDLWAIERRAGKPIYHIFWRDRSAPLQVGQATLETDTGAFAFEAGSRPPWLPVEFAIAALPITNKTMEHWVRLLGIEGNILIEDLAIGAQAGPLGARGRIRLQGARLSLPIGAQEEQLPPDERIFTLHDVEGTIEVSAVGMHAKFTGDLRGRLCEAEMSVTDLPRELTQFSQAAWRLEVSCDDFELLRSDPVNYPAEAQAIKLWPAIRRFYEDFEPKGSVRMVCEIRKEAGADAKPELVMAHFEALDCSGRYRHFPYDLSDITGVVRFSTEGGLEFDDLIGRHGTAVVTINGQTIGRAAQASLDYTIDARSLDLDQDVLAAIPQAWRKTWKALNFSGKANLVTRLTRPAGTDQDPRKVKIAITGHLLDGRASYEGFPYPIENLTGRFEIDEGIELKDIKGTRGSTAVTINGYSKPAENGGRILELDIRGRRLAFDDYLNRAVAPEVRAFLDQLHLEGQADFTGRVFQTPEMKSASYEFELLASEISLKYDKLPYPLSHCSARIVVRPTDIAVRDFVGWRGGTVVEGHMDFQADPKTRGASVNLSARHVPLDETFWQSLPSTFHDAARHFAPEGSVDITLDYREGKDGADSFRTQITAKGIDVTYDAFPLPLEDLTGDIVITPDRVELIGLSARHGSATLAIAGKVDYGAAGTTASFQLSADGMTCSAPLRQALPHAVRQLWDRVNPQGSFDLRVTDLRLARDADSDAASWSADGDARLDNVQLDAALELRDLNGKLNFHGESAATTGTTLWRTQLALDTARINNIAASELTAELIYDQAAELFAVRNIRGRTYGGDITATITASLTEEGRPYDAVCRLTNVDLRSLVEDRPRRDETTPAKIEGLLHASAAIQGRLDDPQQRRGWGRIRVDQAQLYELPLLLGVLNVINLTIPEEGAFQDCSFGFAIRGDRMFLNDIALYGSAMTLRGSGEMNIETTELDLDLDVYSPRKALKIPLLTALLEGAAQELAEIKVTGPAADPRITTRPLRGIRRLFASKSKPPDRSP
ncbi:MAG: AsmA-like C-terminal domain-containing protein [Planctomycetes bacterium]|nr:AsmA-like C-terminal domain-containing protein [Planctomycetota bacterium]